MKKKEERINQLIDILQKRKGMSVRELSLLLNVSEMTIRRDLLVLKERNLILDVHGAVLYNQQSGALEDGQGYSLTLATNAHVKEKDSIGAYAAQMIGRDECIIIDNGSTTENMASHISGDLQATIVSCNLNIINKLYYKPNISLIFGGGYFHPDTVMFESTESIALIRKTRATKVFMSAAGIHETLGVTCANNYELDTKRAIMESGAERILLADSSKFGEVKVCFFGELTDFHRIITDRNIPEEWAEKIRSLGIELTVV